MRASSRRLLIFLSLPLFVVMISAGLYMLGMAHLEHQPRDFWSSLEFAAETLTTTGYGRDMHWDHPVMVLFVVCLQFLGVGLIYLVVPIYLVPYLEERFETRLPSAASPRISHHVVIYRYGPTVETLLEELSSSGVPFLVCEHDEVLARRLLERRIQVVYALTPAAALKGSRWEKARAMIANGSDDENAAFILTARQLGYAGEILALIEEPYHRRPITLAGATVAMTPKHILAAALAAHASQRISPRVSGIQQIGHTLQVSDFRIDPDSELVGKTLEEANLGGRTETTILGQWIHGRLLTQPTATMRLVASGVLIAIGAPQGLQRLAVLAGGSHSVDRRGAFLVCGYGEVGHKVVQLLRDAGEEVEVLDRRAVEGVGLIGDVLDPQLLKSAHVDAARAVILALDEDSATLFATVILNDLAHAVPVIARVNDADNVERIHRAGADFALSVSQVSGQMLAQRLLGQEAVEINPRLKVMRVSSAGLVDHHPADLRVRERTGCSFVAVERGDQVLVRLKEDFVFAPGDAVFVCGSVEATYRYLEVFKQP